MTIALIVAVVVVVLIVLVVLSAIKVVREYERAIVFRLGRLLPKPKGPGIFILIPVVDKMVKVDLRTITLNVPPQDVITRDNVPVRVNAVAYFRIVEPKAAVVQVENYMAATSQISQTTLRSVLGQHSLDELLAERDKINAILQRIIDEQTSPWGIKVSIVEVKDVEIPSGHAARDGAAGRGRARAAREGDRGRGRVPGLRAAEGRGDGDRAAPDRAAAPLPADADRDQLVGLDDDRLPGAGRHPRAAPAASATPRRPPAAAPASRSAPSQLGGLLLAEAAGGVDRGAEVQALVLAPA